MRAFIELGNTTADWRTVRLKRLVRLGTSRTEDRSEGLPYIGLENIEPWTGRRIETGPVTPSMGAEDETGGLANQFSPGDVLFGKLRPYLAKAHIAEQAGLCSTELLVLRPKQVLTNRYLLRVLLTKDFIKLVDSSAFGSKMPRADWEFIGNVEIPVPPISVQTKIADYLDRATAQIDALIAAKERLLSLLAEKRQALIAHTIEGHLSDPVVKLKHFTRILAGYAFPSLEFSRDPEDVRLLRGTNVIPGGTDWSDVVRWPKTDADQYSEYTLQVGDIVFGMDRPWIKSGIRIARISEGDLPCLLLQRVARLRASNGLSQDYLALLLSSKQFAAYFEPLLTGVSVPHISAEQIMEFEFRLPSLDLQKVVVENLHTQFVLLDRILESVNCGVGLLRERRAALIADAVSGQLDLGA